MIIMEDSFFDQVAMDPTRFFKNWDLSIDNQYPKYEQLTPKTSGGERVLDTVVKKTL